MEQHNELFPQGDPAPAEYFTGKVWIKQLSNDPAFHVVVTNVTFERGARTHWHTHPRGQILLVTDGVGYYQEKGKPIQLIRKGEVVNIPPDVEHWHGASVDRVLTHVALSSPTEKGTVVWLQPVTDEEYNRLS